MKRIGPHLIVPDNFVPNMQDAYNADNERGSHDSNNKYSEELWKNWPTVVTMARLIEEERDQLRAKLAFLQMGINAKKKVDS